MRAAIRPPINTVGEPMAITSGGPTQVHISVERAAGCPPISTVGQPGGKIGAPAGGTGGTPGVIIGQVCMSPTLAAGGITGPRTLISCQERADFCPDLESSASVGWVGFA